MDSQTFVRFAARLPWYEGSVRWQITADTSEMDENGERKPKDSNVESTKKIKMSEAIGQVAQDEFSALNYDSQAAGMGDLFERVTVPGT